MLSMQWTSLLVLACVDLVFSQWPRVPDPLPLITPPDVVNILFQDSDAAPGDLVGSVIAADSTAATFLINCATISSCGYAAWDNPIIITQGLSTMHWSYADPASETDGLTLSERCTFNGTTASTAICTNSFNNDYTDAITTLGLDQYGSYIDYQASLFGPPPFIPVKITAGLASLSVFEAAATNTGAVSTNASGSSTQATTSPTITSLAKSDSTAASSSVSSIAGRWVTLRRREIQQGV
ncbi:uncharacterized protein LY89DRAFT_734709 [Mollisia scopiformis]|uniref:Uncharacterized protein n=1 Tax=Mollisia scopiformis TaxID=149040 RepID=A0A194X927_MOLSC|nr:uncharacterized protein LY89DRAFT_734709 [Mollisia scopiformis]KUJ16614.1 hypothetical protein LY89DRAFT_734709 [Mollisia scopiformis]